MFNSLLNTIITMAGFSLSFRYLYSVYPSCPLYSFSTFFVVQHVFFSTVSPDSVSMGSTSVGSTTNMDQNCLGRLNPRCGTHRYGMLTKDLSLLEFWYSWRRWGPGTNHPWIPKGAWIRFYLMY